MKLTKKERAMSECIFVDHSPAADVHTQKVRRARKAHKCVECSETIQPGDLYENASGLWEGVWEEFKTCARCVKVRRDYFESWIYGQMAADFEETHGFDYRKGIPPDFAPCRKRKEKTT